MVNMNLTADLVCLNLSGVDMVTDVLFYVLKFANTNFRMVKKVVFAGKLPRVILNSPSSDNQMQEEVINACELQLMKETQELVQLWNKIKWHIMMQVSKHAA